MKEPNTLIKQAAIKNIGSCSFGKMRSYQDNVMEVILFFPMISIFMGY